MVTLGRNNLTINKLVRVARDREPVIISKKQWPGIRAAQKFVRGLDAEEKAFYGINTGFGALAQVRINHRDIARLQKNILFSHHAGVGEPFAPELVRAAMVLRINNLIMGNSGVSALLIKTLTALVNHGIVPIVPSKGSVGASGDLAPMAAIGLALLGEGRVYYKNQISTAAHALRCARIRRLTLNPKEGLSLINGTQFSTAIAALVNSDGQAICDLADFAGAMSFDGLKGTDRQFHEAIFRIRPHPGAQTSARNIRRLIRNSRILQSHKRCAKVQDPYSLRCMPQVHGAVRDLFGFTKQVIEVEMNSVTDNPVVFPETGLILSSGNFHGEPIAFALDIMAIGLAEIASIAERRVFRLLDSTLSGLKPFLAVSPGLDSGFMMAQVTAAALVSQNKNLCHPASVDSIPTSANQEDHVSMSMNAGLKALEVLDNTKYVLAIELLCACQAIDLLKPLKTSPALERIKKRIRRIVPFVKSDRPLTPLIERIKRMIDERAII